MEPMIPSNHLQTVQIGWTWEENKAFENALTELDHGSPYLFELIALAGTVLSLILITMTSSSLNVRNFVTLKLTQSNYPLWREHVLELAESQDLVGHLTNETPIPTKYTTSDSNTTETGNITPQLTTEFVAWQKSDRLLRGWIIGTLSEKALRLVIGLDTALAVWEALKDAYAQDSQEREFTLRQQLTYLHKDDNKTIGDHIRIFKGLCDNLAAIEKPIPDKENVFCLLTSLGP
ncbi:hypothetical protein ACOSQ2_004504 [Xanthoceras sorbifolium]